MSVCRPAKVRTRLSPTWSMSASERPPCGRSTSGTARSAAAGSRTSARLLSIMRVSTVGGRGGRFALELHEHQRWQRRRLELRALVVGDDLTTNGAVCRAKLNADVVRHYHRHADVQVECRRELRRVFRVGHRVDGVAHSVRKTSGGAACARQHARQMPDRRSTSSGSGNRAAIDRRTITVARHEHRSDAGRAVEHVGGRQQARVDERDGGVVARAVAHALEQRREGGVGSSSACWCAIEDSRREAEPQLAARRRQRARQRLVCDRLELQTVARPPASLVDLGQHRRQASTAASSTPPSMTSIHSTSSTALSNLLAVSSLLTADFAR
jgi:hypothetical protein